jgi:hypothetical protein
VALVTGRVSTTEVLAVMALVLSAISLALWAGQYWSRGPKVWVMAPAAKADLNPGSPWDFYALVTVHNDGSTPVDLYEVGVWVIGTDIEAVHRREEHLNESWQVQPHTSNSWKVPLTLDHFDFGAHIGAYAKRRGRRRGRVHRSGPGRIDLFEL